MSPVEKQISTGNRWRFNVRDMPYRIADDLIDGPIIVFSDVTAFKLPEAELRLKQKKTMADTAIEQAEA